MSPKKLHEVERMVTFLKEFLQKNNCHYVVDVGSGLVSYKFCFVNPIENLWDKVIMKLGLFGSGLSRTWFQSNWS